ncbi:PucR family transcriptional regulator [[Clostridium] colinum]|uniref:PucR family transcriptional regulator n=1 Tax=[Clostridium] colinum TaxID=36835 RepID=UPI002024B855|nr:helix-turn-helix domain-containing protein [[Clostridium] colinum]
MISNQILQSTIDGLKNITRREFSIVDREGKVVVTTEIELVNAIIDGIDFFINSPAENQLVQGYQYFKVLDNGNTEYIVLAKGEDEEIYQIGKIATFQIQSLLIAYKERYDRDNFIKNLLLDNLLLVDIYSRAKKLHIENDVRRIVYLIETEVDKELNTVEVVRSIFPIKGKDFVTAVDEKTIILVKELKDKEDKETVEQFANEMHRTLTEELNKNVLISIGSIVYDLKNISSSFKEAKMALEVGKIFEEDKNIIKYEQLGIGRLIYQLPNNLCKMFVGEVLDGITMASFDEETLATVAKFFENNLNVSETSRQLYIHRNTLVYRLDKLQKMTGLDLRNFDDAIIFKIMLMVSKYMQYRENFKY